MPEPPFQNDMRSQGVPPRPTAHPASAVFAGSGSLTALLLTVTRPEQLPDALKQHEKQVVIENTPANARLTQDFERLLRWEQRRETLLIIALVFVLLAQMAITNRYKLEADWHVKWKVIEMGGKITLTPSQK
jgi:hypothetical protein